MLDSTRERFFVRGGGGRGLSRTHTRPKPPPDASRTNATQGSAHHFHCNALHRGLLLKRGESKPHGSPAGLHPRAPRPPRARASPSQAPPSSREHRHSAAAIFRPILVVMLVLDNHSAADEPATPNPRSVLRRGRQTEVGRREVPERRRVRPTRSTTVVRFIIPPHMNAEECHPSSSDTERQNKHNIDRGKKTRGIGNRENVRRLDHGRRKQKK